MIKYFHKPIAWPKQRASLQYNCTRLRDCRYNEANVLEILAKYKNYVTGSFWLLHCLYDSLWSWLVFLTVERVKKEIGLRTH